MNLDCQTVSKSVIDIETDISNSCTESEDEVEAQIALSLQSAGTAIPKAILSSDGEDSDSQSSSSESSTPLRQQGRRTKHSPIDIDANEDGLPTANAYLLTTHEIPPSAIPVPPLPDPSTLPQEALELAGEVMTILPDSVTIRGGCSSSSSARERRLPVLDEGTLLLLDDRTPLGYVSETFGPTILPHYLVRIKRSESTLRMVSASQSSTDDSSGPVQVQTALNTENNSGPAPSQDPPLTPPPQDCLDPSKIFVSRPVYHIPSLSKFVFPTTLATLKGSDASNIHDEEIAEHERDFSDDEVEATHKRLRRGFSSRSASEAPIPGTFDGEGGGSILVAADEASSLYGASPYDSENTSSHYKQKDYTLSSPSCSDPPAPSLLINFEDTAVKEALMLARNSRHRRHTSVSISEASSAIDAPRAHEQDLPYGRARRGGRARGKDRGRSRNIRGTARGRGRMRDPGVAPEIYDVDQMVCGNGRSSFSFEEYDPHMPRPPSPTALAIARATGQWADGTPFPYDSGATSVGSAMRYYDPTVPQTLGYPPHVRNYGVAPHINPRFAQGFQLPNSAPGSSMNPHDGSPDTHISHARSEPSEAEQGVRSPD